MAYGEGNKDIIVSNFLYLDLIIITSKQYIPAHFNKKYKYLP